MNSISALLASPRFWPRAAVWGGAIASTAMNLSSNWHADTVNGITTFIAPTAGGLHLPEVTKLVVSAAFPLLLIFAVESAARTSLRFSWRDSGSYAMPLGAIIVFCFSVGEVTRLLVGMGQPLVLALLFALAPDVLITAGTVVLMRERTVPAQASQDEAVPAPAVETSRPQDEPAAVPAVAVPSRPEREALVRPDRPVSQPTRPASREDVASQDGTAAETGQEAERRAADVVLAPVSQDAQFVEAVARIQEYRDSNDGKLPTANWVKNNCGMGHARATRLLNNIDNPESGRVELHAVHSAAV